MQTIAALMAALCKQGVEYCHWKSNIRLAESLNGRTDLDLLVNRRDSRIFRRILAEHDIKPVLAPAGKRYPALEDYLGFDPEAGRMFHLHVHYQLVLGEQFVKNYRLPLEAQFFASARLQDGVLIPAPELEISVLALRALLKYRDRDAVKDLLSTRHPGMPAAIQKEIRYLLDQTSHERIAATLAGIADVVPADAVLELLDVVVHTPRDGTRLLRLRGRVRQALRPYRRHSRARATLTYFHELWRRRNSFLRRSPARQMTPANGGLTLALVGADGAGKSTMSELLRQWLGWKLDVRSYYLGSKQPSHRSRSLYMLFRMARRSQRTAAQWRGDDRPPASWLAGLRDTLLHAHHLSIGHDRLRRYEDGTKQAMAGSIVVFDRFPLESVSDDEDFRLLDGPQIAETAGKQPGLLTRALAAAERKVYAAMRLPDFLCVLQVSPDVSLARKPDHQRAPIEAKARAVDELIAMQTSGVDAPNLIPVNADLPLEVVLRQLKERIWQVL